VKIATLPVGMSSYHDSSATPGAAYRYNIVSLTDDKNAKMWSIKVLVPKPPRRGEDISKSMLRQANTESEALLTAATSTVTWTTFIPQSRIAAPAVGCDYGSGYEFAGDGHGFDWTASSHRTSVSAVIDWSAKTVAGYVSIGTSHVYRKSDGKLVASKTASGANSYAKKIISDANSIDVRFVTLASNPFCHVGAIDGSFSMHLTHTGNYSFVTGNHVQMPNHHVYIYDGGGETDVYEKKAYGPECLLGDAVCERANFSGSGSF
jgi:hypothetical protein